MAALRSRHRRNPDVTQGSTASRLVGLIPAAGRGTRLGTLPCSKEVYPVGWAVDAAGSLRPVAAAESLIRNFGAAGARQVFLILRDGKWDIPSYLGDGGRFGVSLAYLMMRWPYGQPFTLDAAHPFVEEATVLFGFPDILFEPEDAFIPLLERLDRPGADVVLGLFPARRPEKMDMVELDDSGRVRRIAIKPERTDLRFAWIIAAWERPFTAFLHQWVSRALAERNGGGETEEGAPDPLSTRELYLGDVLQQAMREGLGIEGVTFEEGRYIDIGTPTELRDAVRTGAGGVPNKPVDTAEGGGAGS